jgi:hypothetical protein
LDDAHAYIQDIFHELFTAARIAILLLLVVASAKDGHAEDIQALCLDGNSNHLTVSLLSETFFKQSLDNILQLALDTALQHKGCLLVHNASVVATGVCGIDARNLCTREQ